MKLRFGEQNIGEFYHVFNRGVEKKKIFHDKEDRERFLRLCRYCNQEEPLSSLKEFFESKREKKICREKLLVEVYGFCILNNHFHFVLKQIRRGGISEFMKRISGGYANYYNKKYQRNGTLFQGKYKFILIKSESQLTKLISYVNKNYKIHNSNDLMCSGNTEILSKNEFVLTNSQNVIAMFGGTNRYEEISESLIQEIKSSRLKDSIYM